MSPPPGCFSRSIEWTWRKTKMIGPPAETLRLCAETRKREKMHFYAGMKLSGSAFSDHPDILGSATISPLKILVGSFHMELIQRDPFCQMKSSNSCFGQLSCFGGNHSPSSPPSIRHRFCAPFSARPQKHPNLFPLPPPLHPDPPPPPTHTLINPMSFVFSSICKEISHAANLSRHRHAVLMHSE